MLGGQGGCVVAEKPCCTGASINMHTIKLIIGQQTTGQFVRISVMERQQALGPLCPMRAYVRACLCRCFFKSVWGRK